MNKYSFVIQWSDEDGEYVATCPEFPGLSAFGEDEEEAIREGKTALEGMIQAYKKKNIPLPVPRKEEHYSGQFRVRIPKSQHRQLSEMARDDNVSLNTMVIIAIARLVEAHAITQATNRMIYNWNPGALYSLWSQAAITSRIPGIEIPLLQTTTSRPLSELSVHLLGPKDA